MASSAAGTSAYKNVVGGKLRLKGTVPKGAVKKHEGVPVIKNVEAVKDLLVIPEETKTAAEIAFERKQQERENERVAKFAEKSHKERVEEYNKYLASLSEHHDIPKVDPRNQ